MGIRTSLILCLWLALLLAAGSVCAQTFYNPSFEDGLYGWTTYSYTSGSGTNAVEPTADCSGYAGCTFDLLNPGPPPDGAMVCGIQSANTNGNGGVCQYFVCGGGPTMITVSARNYAENSLGQPYDNGSLVRMGLVADFTQDRTLVTNWVTFPWSDQWTDRQLPVPGPGIYTLFIEAYQPSSSGTTSTLWDNIRFGQPVNITNGPNVTPDPSHPEASTIVTWTTDVPSSSRVDYGASAGYGRSVSSDAPTTFHTLTITGLTRSSTYHYRVTSVSGDYTVQSLDDTFTTPIQMFDLNVSLSDDNLTAYVSWSTDVATGARVEYWPEMGTHQTIIDESPIGTDHQVVLSLIDGKEYHFIATSQGSSPYTSISQSGKFFTLPAPSDTLTNGGFENVDGGGQHTLYPWVQYTTEVGVPSPQPIDGLIGPYRYDGSDQWNAGIRAYNGSYFLGTEANWSYKNGGVLQRVNVMPDQYCVLSARFITYRLGGEDGYNAVRFGVDPNGGTDPTSPDVKWWTGYSDTNNNQWHTASLSIVAGPSGLATVFLEFRQRYSIEWHVAAVDGVSFLPPAPVSIGALKASPWALGAVLDSKIVTWVSPGPVYVNKVQYMKAYVEEDNRSSGVAVLFPSTGTDYPVVGNKLTVTGALAEYGKEAALMADYWAVDHSTTTLPVPLTLTQKAISTKVNNQPPLFSNNVGLCTIGLRVRLFGKVTWASSEGDTGDVVAYIDDGTGMADPSGNKGVRVYLPGKGSGTGIHVGDHVAVTGVLGIEFVDPDNWPDPTDFYTYSVFTNAADDWIVTPGS